MRPAQEVDKYDLHICIVKFRMQEIAILPVLVSTNTRNPISPSTIPRIHVSSNKIALSAAMVPQRLACTLGHLLKSLVAFN